MAEEKLAGKQILLLYSRFFCYDRIVKNKLESLGACVDLFDARANISSLGKAIRKIYSGLYFKKQKRFHEKIQHNNSHKRYDFIFSNDVLDEKILQQYRTIFPTATMVLYLDDSVQNMKNVEKTFPYYDRVLSFDKQDSDVFNLVFRPLFFADCFSTGSPIDQKKEFDISFVGTCHSDRLRIINRIQKRYPSTKNYFFCYMQSWFMYYYHIFFEKEYRSVKKSFFHFKPLEVKDVAVIMSKSKCVLDIQHPGQVGLTMRTIEAIGARRKLITTNADIKNYDIYNKNNIQIINRNNPVIDLDFLYTNYQPIEGSLYEKYSIDGWVKDVFKKKD